MGIFIKKKKKSLYLAYYVMSGTNKLNSCSENTLFSLVQLSDDWVK